MTIPALMSSIKIGDDVRRLAFAQHDDVHMIESINKGRKCPGTSGHNLKHRHAEPGRRCTPMAPGTVEVNRQSMLRGIQSAWRLADEADACRADELPD